MFPRINLTRPLIEGRYERIHFLTQPIELARFFQWKIIDLSITYAYFLKFREFFHREGPGNETDYIVCAKFLYGSYNNGQTLKMTSDYT